LSPRIPINREKVEAFCKKWKIVELSLFGSVIRDDFREDSDVDVLVSFSKDSRWSLFDVIHAENELSVIVGRKVDLMEREAIEDDPNWIRRRHIMNHRQIYHVA